MLGSRVACVMLSLAVVPIWAGAAPGADQPMPEDALKSRGLSVKRGGSTYVLAAEADVQAKTTEAQRLYKQLRYALGRQHEFDQEADRLKRMVPGLLEERIFRNQQLRTIDPRDVIQHNQLVARLNEINDQLRLIDTGTADPRIKQEIDNVVAHRRAAYIQIVLDLRKLVDDVKSQYAALGKDDSVKQALASLGSAPRSPLKLGPSRGFDECVKQLEKWEKSVLSKAIEMRRRGGVYEIDVTLNGTATTPMIFDTGASLITLSTEFAARIGLKPQPTDPTVQLHDATGGITAAKKMTLSSVRVGPFTVNNVACVVMPPDKRDVPLLLGQSFINQFTHKVDNGRLMLSRVETAESPASSSRTPTKKVKAKRSSKAAVGAPSTTADPESSL